MSQKDLYQILGVKETASAAEVKKAYRELAKKHHPDKTGGDKVKEARFKEVGAAYEVLSDPKRRQQYDAMRRGGFRMGDKGFDMSGFQGIDGIEDLFGQIFGSMGGMGGMGGGRRGSGARVIFESSPFGGFGGGFGRRPEPGPPEPVEAKVQIGSHEFTRRGDDLYFDLELAVDEAVLGGKVDVPTPDGRVTLTLPAGTSSGQKLRLRGKGLPTRSGGRGDLYAVTRIIVPPSVDDRGAELIREFARRSPVKPRR